MPLISVKKYQLLKKTSSISSEYLRSVKFSFSINKYPFMAVKTGVAFWYKNSLGLVKLKKVKFLLVTESALPGLWPQYS